MSAVPLHHMVLASTYYPLKLAKTIGRTLKLCSSNRLRVMIYHDIAPQLQSHFAAQLRWLAKSWNFVTPDHFAAMVSGKEPVCGSNLLLTFDDGFASNRRIAESVLGPMGIKAIFFIVSDFVDIQDSTEARSFIAEHISPGLQVDDLPQHWQNMLWTDLIALLEQGHTIGAHTRTHAQLSQINADYDLVQEIISGADVLAQRLGIAIEHFAYPFGDIVSFSRSALNIAKSRFRFIYSGIRGDNAAGISPYALRRDAVTAGDSMSLMGAFLEGGADFHHAPFRAQLDAWSCSA